MYHVHHLNVQFKSIWNAKLIKILEGPGTKKSRKIPTTRKNIDSEIGTVASVSPQGSEEMRGKDE